MNHLYEINCPGCQVTSYVGFTANEDDHLEQQRGIIGHLTMHDGVFIHCFVCDEWLSKADIRECEDPRESTPYRPRSWVLEASDFLDDNKKVAAIKVAREINGWSLKYAKREVEALPAHRTYNARTL